MRLAERDAVRNPGLSSGIAVRKYMSGFEEFNARQPTDGAALAICF
jgi:hypothetical protein